MARKFLLPLPLPGLRPPVHSDIIIGGSGGGQPLHLVILTMLVLVMALISVYDAAFGGGNGGVNLDKRIPFKCTNCNNIVMYTIRDLQKMQKPGRIDRVFVSRKMLHIVN